LRLYPGFLHRCSAFLRCSALLHFFLYGRKEARPAHGITCFRGLDAVLLQQCGRLGLEELLQLILAACSLLPSGIQPGNLFLLLISLL
jgi:hypothetical protein